MNSQELKSFTLNTILHIYAFCCTVLRTQLNFPHFPLLHVKFLPSSWTHTHPNNNTDTGRRSAAGIPPTKSGAATDTAVASSVPTGNAAGATGFALAFLHEIVRREKEQSLNRSCLYTRYLTNIRQELRGSRLVYPSQMSASIVIFK